MFGTFSTTKYIEGGESLKSKIVRFVGSTGISRESHLMGRRANEYTFQVIVTELAEIESSLATTLWKKCSASASIISTSFSSNLISRSFEGAFNITSNGGV
jgi:hypothetical protein